MPVTRIASTDEVLATMLAKWETAESTGFQNPYLSVLNLVETLGCQYAVYQRRRPVPLAEPRYETIHNLPAGLIELCNIPTADNCALGIKFWEYQQKETSNYYWGWTVRLGPTSGGDASLAGISDRSLSVDDSRRALIVCTAYLANVLFSRATKSAAHATYKLSRREVEVLRWSGDGKSSAEIASLLSVSENTINFHQKSVKEKLSCSTKTSSAVYAAMLGLLS